MAKRKTAAKQADQQDIGKLTERYHELNTRKIQAQTNLDNARKRLAELKDKAKKEYDTDDLDELQKQLDKLRDDNEKKRSKYQASLDEIEEKLGQVEREHGPLEEVDAAEDEEE